MIDLNRTRVIVATYPTLAIDYRMLTKLVEYGIPLRNIVAAKTAGNVIERRNRIVKKLVLPVTCRYDWFMFIDHDHYPEGKRLDPFFDDVDADVVGCEYQTGNKNSWLTPDIFHMGMVRIRGEMFEKIPPPWFMFKYNEDGTKIVDCECNYLKAKLLGVGARITHRGRVGHDSNQTWH